ncbi:Adenosine receptor A2a [Holothuria leucospilota]|uniref:Adenosine receptor A2a n=1 Tax=Holothuria leucospilota TaxID=206669 RepID=A0A9Q1CK23_HOLLE|nr:Adenosine receptor A2a [Holothuria leucospilota]
MASLQDYFSENVTAPSQLVTSLEYQIPRGYYHEVGTTFSPLITFVYVLVYFPIWCISIIDNGLVIFAFIENAYLRKIMNYPLVSLAVNDFLTGLVALPLHLTARLVQSRATCLESSRAILFLPSMVLFVSSVLHLIGIAVMRYVSLLRPMRFRSIVTEFRVKFTLATCWALSTLQFTFFLIGVSQAEENWICQGGVYKSVIAVHHFLLATLILPVVLIGMFCLYLFMVRKAFLQLKRRRRFCSQRSSQLIKRRQMEARSRFRGSVTMAIVVGAFSLCWMPTSFSYIFCTLKTHHLTRTVQSILSFLCEYPTFLNATLNPIIYAYRNSDFHDAFIHIWERFKVKWWSSRGT